MKLNKIIDIVNQEFGVDIRENKRNLQNMYALKTYVHLARENTYYVFEEIGKRVNRGYPTIMHHLNGKGNILELIKINKYLAEKFNNCESKLKNKTSTNHENGNDANRLLTAGIRVKLQLADVNSKSFVIPNFHFVPRKDDFIDVENLIDEKNYSDEELDEIYSITWSVWYVNWGKDEFGFYAEIVCEAE